MKNSRYYGKRTNTSWNGDGTFYKLENWFATQTSQDLGHFENYRYDLEDGDEQLAWYQLIG